MALPGRPVIVVIGAGFGGLKVVLRLRKLPVDIILIDKRNYHLFQPLLYQVATAGLSPADIAYPIRRVFRKQKNVAVVLGMVEFIDLANRQFGAGDKRFPYDWLVVATGAMHSYFGHPEWAAFAPGLKTLEDAIEIRSRMLLAFEEAEYEADEQARRAKLTFVVIGGGPTGVEMAGALREIAAQDIQRDFRNIDTSTTRIILVQGADRLLPSMDADLGERAKRDLEAMGVQVRLNARVTHIDEGGVWIGQEHLPAHNILWAAGVEAQQLPRTLGVPLDQAGRVLVGADLSIPGHRRVFVIGDAAAATDARTQQPVPGLAPAAMQMGAFVAAIIRAELTDPTPPKRPEFHYVDQGMMATIGKRRAVADIKGVKVKGFAAWVLWCFVHLMFLVSFRNKLWVMLNWMYEYVTGSREVRLISGEVRMKINNLRRVDQSP